MHPLVNLFDYLFWLDVAVCVCVCALCLVLFILMLSFFRRRRRCFIRFSFPLFDASISFETEYLT